MKRGLLALTCVTAVSAVGAVIWLGCETPLAPSYQLTDARILAIQSTPVDLVPDGAISLNALVYLPPGAPAPSYQWSWCAAVGTTLQCSVDAGQLTQILDQDGSFDVNIDYSIGLGAQALMSFPVAPSVLRAACGGSPPDAGADAEADAGDAEEEAGATVLVEAGASALRLAGIACNATSWTIYVMLDVGVGNTSLQAVRSITVYLATPSSTNTNPTVVGLSPFAVAPTDAGALGNPGELADGSVIDAAIGAQGDAGIWIAAQIPLSATDLYIPTTGTVPESDDASDDAAGLPPCPADAEAADGGCVPETYESLTLSWYVQGGLLQQATTTLPSVRLGLPQDWNALLVNRWSPPSSAGSTQFILVLRDNRGGVGWFVAPVQTSASGSP